MRKIKTHAVGLIAVVLAGLVGLALAEGRQLESASGAESGFTEHILRTVTVIRYVDPESPFAAAQAAPTCATELTKKQGRIELIRHSSETTNYDDPEGLLSHAPPRPSCDAGPVAENSYERVYGEVGFDDVFDRELAGLGG